MKHWIPLATGLLALAALIFTFAAPLSPGASNSQDALPGPAPAYTIRGCEAPRTDGPSHTAGGGGPIPAVSLGEMPADSGQVVVGTVRQLQSCATEGPPSVVTLVSIPPQ